MFLAPRISLVLLIVAFTACGPRSSTTPPPPAPTPAPTPAPAPSADGKKWTPLFDEEPVASADGVATWYDVPDESLPERRAPGEFTAAYDRLPIGSYARVTAKETGKAVVVCITDTGVGKRRGIDLCKEAAEELGIVEKGELKVRIDTLSRRKDVPKEK